MRCRKAEKQLALLVGGDLPKKKVAELISHLDSCRSCADEMERLKQSQELFGKIANADKPDPLPKEFSHQVLLDILESKAKKRRFLSEVVSIFSWKPALALSGTVFVILLVFGMTQDLLKSRKRFFVLKGNASVKVHAVNSGEVAWGAKFAFIKDLIGPSPLNEIEFPEEPGIYAIIHKPDPINRPKIFAVDFIGENSELPKVRESLLSIGKGELLIPRAGSGDNLYIVLYPMPESSREERRRLKDSLINKYKPYIHGNGGI